MLDYHVKIGLLPMRRDTTDRPRGTFLTWYSAEERGRRFVAYIEAHFASEQVSFVDTKGLGTADLIFNADSADVTVPRNAPNCSSVPKRERESTSSSPSLTRERSISRTARPSLWIWSGSTRKGC